VKDERVAARPLDRHDFANKYDVVPGRMSRVVAAFEPRDAAVDQWGVGPSQTMRDAGETIGVRP